MRQLLTGASLEENFSIWKYVYSIRLLGKSRPFLSERLCIASCHMTWPRGTVLDVIRSPLICGAGPDSERCGRQHGKALAALCLVIPRRDSTLLLLFGLASPNKLTAGFNGEAPQCNAVYPKCNLSTQKLPKTPDREFPHWALQAWSIPDRWLDRWTDGRSVGDTSTQWAQFQGSLAGVWNWNHFVFWLFNMSIRCTGHIATQTGRNISQILVAFHGDERSELTKDHDISCIF